TGSVAQVTGKRYQSALAGESIPGNITVILLEEWAEKRVPGVELPNAIKTEYSGNPSRKVHAKFLC
ncbi:MAG: hypothetical protein KDE53_06960, partial [Caldilineaceae bacterium]|nr:hypothetical protein [Caldilineaceae bacterium]MCB0183080.1 hypothetical protein [Caldilineaceae bacterium]